VAGDVLVGRLPVTGSRGSIGIAVSRQVMDVRAKEVEMRGGLQLPVDGWAVFEAVEPGSELLMFAGGMAYEARSPLRVLGKQMGALYLRVAQGVARTGEDVREKLADGRTVLGEAVKGTTGAVHAVAVWCGEGTPPPHPAINTWDVNFETRTSNATGDLTATWDDGRRTTDESGLPVPAVLEGGASR